MIKFFRRIRKALFAENKYNKYIFYAIGEIILVVIGILIALQINAWKVSADNKKLEKSILLNIKQDLQDDILDLQNVAAFKIQQRETCKRLINLATNRSLPVLDTVQFANDVVRVIYFTLPSSNKTTFEMATSNGYLNIISNDSLIKLIAKYYSDITLNQHVTETKRFTNSFAESVIMKKYRIFSNKIAVLDGLGGEYYIESYQNVDEVQFPYADFRRDLEVENHLNSFAIRLKIGINYLQNKEKRADELINRIDKYIKVSS